jgi:Flp pilus assembly protein TadG
MEAGSMKPSRPHFSRWSRRGQAVVELALTSPFLILFSLIVSDGCRVYFTSIAVNNAAKAGAQYGAQSLAKSGDIAGMQNAAIGDAPQVYGISATASVYCECPDVPGSFSCSSTMTCSDKRAYVQIDTSATFHTLISYPLIPDTVPITGQAIMRVE